MTHGDDRLAGFTPNLHPSPFLSCVGDLYWRRDDRTGFFQVALVVGETDMNSRGTAHGGVVTTIADVLLGHTAAALTDPRTPLTTASLTVDFVRAVPLGALLVGSVEFAALRGALAFARGSFAVADEVVAQMTGCYRVVRTG